MSIISSLYPPTEHEHVWLNHDVKSGHFLYKTQFTKIRPFHSADISFQNTQPENKLLFFIIKLYQTCYTFNFKHNIFILFKG